MTKTLITGGTIVTASDNYKADVLVDGEKIAMIGRGMKAAGAKTIDATGKYVIPGGIDVHTHMELPFGGTTRPTTSRPARRRRVRRHDDASSTSPCRAWASRCRRRSNLAAKAEGKARIDYALPHDRARRADEVPRARWTTMVTRGRHVLQAVHGVPGRLHGRRRDDLQGAAAQRGENGGLICMHAENGGVIDVLVQAGAREGAHRAEVPRAHAPARGRGRGDGPRDRARRDGGRAGVHRPPLGRATRSSRSARRATAACPRTPRPARSTCSSRRQLRRARLRGREVRHDAAAAREVAPGRAVARPRAQRPAGRLAPTTARSA